MSKATIKRLFPISVKNSLDSSDPAVRELAEKFGVIAKNVSVGPFSAVFFEKRIGAKRMFRFLETYRTVVIFHNGMSLGEGVDMCDPDFSELGRALTSLVNKGESGK